MDDQNQRTPEVASGDASQTEITPPSRRRKNRRAWILWAVINLTVGGYLIYGLLAPASTIKTAFLPGKTTHGHFQIELDCNACHSPVEEGAAHSSENLMQDACIKCHGEQLKLAKDTHPAKKFNDPTNADRLLILDAQNCLTCHREHVPDQTEAMGLTIPSDYCWHCHQEVGETRPSHQSFAFDSCATAGCHNYHDNRALYEKYLNEHHGEADHLDVARLLPRNFSARWKEGHDSAHALTSVMADAPAEFRGDGSITKNWSETAHAAAGVNCSGCHVSSADGADPNRWSDAVELEVCRSCHQKESDSFLTGKHGMRLAAGMTPMTPAIARLPMHSEAAHRELTCIACHSDHRFDTRYAAAEACLKCHSDDHSLAYLQSPHAELWQSEMRGDLESGAGVSCATCHMPRLQDGDGVWVNHDQNSTLRPNETMARQVCNRCHGLEYSLSALAEPIQVEQCFAEPPETRTESVQMAHDWFLFKESKRKQRESKRGPPQSAAR